MAAHSRQPRLRLRRPILLLLQHRNASTLVLDLEPHEVKEVLEVKLYDSVRRLLIDTLVKAGAAGRGLRIVQALPRAQIVLTKHD